MREGNFGCPKAGVFRGTRDQLMQEFVLPQFLLKERQCCAQSIVSGENLSLQQGYNQSFQMSYQVEQGCGRERSRGPQHAWVLHVGVVSESPYAKS